MMKNSSKILLIILILLISGAILLPFWFLTDSKDAVNMSDYLIRTIFSVVTMIIAFLLFDRFGVSKKALNKNVETVFELLEVIKSKRIYAEYESDAGYFHTEISISDNLDKSRIYKIMLEKDILFNNEDIENGLREINQFAYNIWIPVQIKDKIKKLSLLSATSVKDNFISKNKCVMVNFNLYPEARKGKDIIWFMTNNKKTTFNDFLTNLEDLVAEIKNWLSNHSNYDLELNI